MGRWSRTRPPQATFGGALFLFGGLVSLLGATVPLMRSAQTDPGELALLGSTCLAIGFALLLVPRRWGDRVPVIGVAGAIVIIAWGLRINGEAAGGPPVFSELFFLWPILYAGYFFPPWRTAIAVAAIGVLYLAALVSIGYTASEIGPRYIIVMVSFTGMAVALRFLRVTVDRLLERLKDAARTDALTGLLNRRAFDQQLHAEITRSHRTGEPFALVLGDIDHFKQINDRRGHAEGDAALQAVADLLSATARQVDTVARIGGEEFALILPGTTAAGGVEAAERIRRALLDTPSAPTMSFGIVEGPADGSDADDLLRGADRALYRAKANGRDRVERTLVA